MDQLILTALAKKSASLKFSSKHSNAASSFRGRISLNSWKDCCDCLTTNPCVVFKREFIFANSWDIALSAESEKIRKILLYLLMLIYKKKTYHYYSPFLVLNLRWTYLNEKAINKDIAILERFYYRDAREKSHNSVLDFTKF